MPAHKSQAGKGSLILCVFKIDQFRSQGQHGAGDNFAAMPEWFAGSGFTFCGSTGSLPPIHSPYAVSLRTEPSAQAIHRPQVQGVAAEENDGTETLLQQ
jgi:hypothetical protein